MSRRLVVTVGTSLFTSASWRSEGPFGLIQGYPTWSREYSKSPRDRREAGGATAGDLRDRLAENWRDDVDYFVWPADTKLRYSAEVATLLRWAEHQGAGEPPAFLAERYGEVHLVCPYDRTNDSRIAAGYLHAVMTRKWTLENVKLRDVLTGSSIADAARHFRAYLESLGSTAAPTDLVVSGGYKLFAMYASLFAAATQWRRENWRVIYVHEESQNELIVQKGDEDGVTVDVDGSEGARFTDSEGLVGD